MGRTHAAALTLLLLALAPLSGCAELADALDELGRELSPPARDPLAPPANGTLRIHYLDVGQGDATVWELPGGGIVVFDCGPPADSAQTNAVVRYLDERLGREPGSRIHALVASHGHLDHIGGCDEVFDTYEVRHVYDVWYTGDDAPQSYARFQDAVEQEVATEGATLHTLASGASGPGPATFGVGTALSLPDEARRNGTRATILWPGAFQGSGWDDIARSGIVVRLTFGETSACFQGDIEEREEAALASSAPPDACDVYLVGHHGSRHASTQAWLTRMDPEVAVVSFGTNPYGHPTSEALCRVQEAGAQVYATHRVGDVVVTLDGENVTVEPDAPETQDYCAAGAEYDGWS